MILRCLYYYYNTIFIQSVTVFARCNGKLNWKYHKTHEESTFFCPMQDSEAKAFLRAILIQVPRAQLTV